MSVSTMKRQMLRSYLPPTSEVPKCSSVGSATFQKLAGKGRRGKDILEPRNLKMVVSNMDQSGLPQRILHVCFAAAQSLS